LFTARAEASHPRFIERMANQTVKQGEPVTFCAVAEGVPTPMMSWQKDGRMISSDNQYQIQTDNGRSTLHMPSAAPQDHAWWQCTAANIAGTASNRARLIVQGITSIDTNSYEYRVWVVWLL